MILSSQNNIWPEKEIAPCITRYSKNFYFLNFSTDPFTLIKLKYHLNTVIIIFINKQGSKYPWIFMNRNINSFWSSSIITAFEHSTSFQIPNTSDPYEILTQKTTPQNHDHFSIGYHDIKNIRGIAERITSCPEIEGCRVCAA